MGDNASSDGDDDDDDAGVGDRYVGVGKKKSVSYRISPDDEITHHIL